MAKASLFIFVFYKKQKWNFEEKIFPQFFTGINSTKLFIARQLRTI